MAVEKVAEFAKVGSDTGRLAIVEQEIQKYFGERMK
jgi:hypothetical protein